ncbi:Gfo/Idh/MocA family protein [Martelella soudanensis]|uniref:Gfo/Idh/MocA family protein n=1 Tax=unclassified Martelella TaxID=2629616 RepID=UPI0015DFB86B|nr:MULTISPECIES: Gfo/Idh/MocA family oxidoreductase [unclassified Martelella]
MKAIYGIIGCGMMGQEHLRNIALLPEAEIGAIFEPDPAMRAKAAALAPRARLCDSLAELLSVEAITCLLIASPNHLHLAQMEEIARTRPLPLMVEKPLFTDPGDTARIAGFKAHYPAPVWVAMEYRYMPPIARLLSEAESVTGGVRMLTIREHRFPFLEKVGNWNRFNRYSGGTLVEKCCHFFDLMRLVMKSDPVRIMASGGQAVNHRDEIVNGNERPDVWDHAYVIVDFASGSRAALELCMFAEGSRFQEEITAIGPEGKIECHVPGPTRFWPAELGAPPDARMVYSPRNPRGPREAVIAVDPTLLMAGDHNGSTFYQHRSFIAAIAGSRPVEVSLADGWWAVAMGHAAQQSAMSGHTVKLEGDHFRVAV